MIIFIPVYEKQPNGTGDCHEVLGKKRSVGLNQLLNMSSKSLKAMLTATSCFSCTSAVLHFGWKCRL